ncbi:MAG: alanine racemase [Lachnospiraceae bacterium]|nr:alanine racemase [Lachnospiraceae bacterium]
MKKELTIDRMKLSELVKTLGTPSYVFDTDILQERVRMVSQKLAPAKLCYAIKANPFLIRAMDALVDRYEVCSPGEFHICVKNELDMEKIVLSGVYKAEADVRYAMEQGVRHFTAESVSQFRLIQSCADKLGKKVDILLRVTSGCQFGMNEEDVRSLLREREQYPQAEIVGLQYFTGTQKKQIKKIAAELQYMEDFIRRLEAEEGFVTRTLEYGPGLGVPYFTKDDFEEDERLLDEFAALFTEERPYELVFEMGRYLAASCGYYMTKIVDQKKNDAVNVLIADGGIHHVNYYGQNMAMKTPVLSYFPQHLLQGEEEEWTVYGALCTTADILLKRLPLVDARVGDYLVFHNIGAYAVTEGMYLFLSRDMPRIYLYSEETGPELIRDTLETWKWNT